MRKFGILVMSIILAVSMTAMTACDNGGKNSGTSSSASSTATLEDEAGKTVSIMIPGHDPSDQESSMNSTVAKFKIDYPAITTEFVVAGWDNWMTKVTAAASSGDAIDVINDGANNNPMFAMKKITQPIQNYINMDNPNLDKNAMEAVFKYRGDYYVAATSTSVCVIFYNKDIFANAGIEEPLDTYNKGEWTFEKFVSVAKQLTSTDSNNMRWGFATNYPYIFFGANATSMLTFDEENRYVLNIDSPALKQSLDLIADGWNISNWQGWEGNPWNAFYNGTAAMLGDFQWVDQQILDVRAFGLANFDYGVAPMPVGPNNTEGLSPITTGGYAIGYGADAPMHAGKLIDMIVDSAAENAATDQSDIDPDHLALYKELAKKPYCTNSYDSAVGGAFEIAQAITAGQSVTQAIEQYKPVYQRMVEEANAAIED